MRKLFCILALVLLLPALSLAELKIVGSLKVDPYKLVRLNAEGAPEGSALLWDYDEDVLDGEATNGKLVFIGPPGKYRIKLTAIRVDTKTSKVIAEVTKVVVVIGDPVPPKPPIPPDPPEPKPSPSPIPEIGFRVLMVYDASKLTTYPKKQADIFFNASLRSYLNSKCVVGSDGKTKEWRMWDKGVDAGAESKIWQDVMKRDRKSIPWLLVSNHPKGGFEGPLPATVEETMVIIKKYGGD